MYEIKLYVVGRTTKLLRGIEQLVGLLEDELHSYYRLDVIDIIESPELAEKDRIFATPTLVKVFPAPIKKIIGRLSNKEEVSLALGLTA